MDELHSLLRRQLKRYVSDQDTLPQPLIDAVNAAYQQSDADRATLERSLELTSQELLQANAEMRHAYLELQQHTAALRQAKEELELRVAERTAELRQANEQLQHELAERKQVEAELREQKQLFENLVIEVSDSLAELSTLIEASQDGIIFINLAGQMRVINAAALSLLGLPGKPGDWVDRPSAQTLIALRRHAPGATRAILHEIRRRRDGNTSSFEGEYRLPPRVVRWSYSPVLSANTLIGWLFVLRDVTKERMLEKMRDDLTYTMVHDLRNPLAAILLNLQLLTAKEGQSLSGKQRKTLVDVLGRTRQMANLVNAILEVSQLESGQLPLNQAPASLADLVSETLDLEAPLARQKNLVLKQTLPAWLPPIYVDLAMMQRILQNLVGNAIKFTPAGGVIELGARLDKLSPASPDSLNSQPMLRVFVRDSGPGVPAELQGRLFQKFVAAQQESRGNGLGLAFCRLAVEAHGGRIWVESEPGRGATFHFTVPLAI
ncbi:MAG: ATP-binding protein [Chloroflexi bacterium]|nr:ATP-binding protein [Chloroflexota bacterium]MCI0578695.1 ATP-binding protein [Chloroflexota bacterium]MCI0648355.1 ATP-binding protein [Chloroflexota bacterium]MCI0731177.1 ATP-binding protein [Chloroflexota bacterium]